MNPTLLSDEVKKVVATLAILGGALLVSVSQGAALPHWLITTAVVFVALGSGLGMVSGGTKGLQPTPAPKTGAPLSSAPPNTVIIPAFALFLLAVTGCGTALTSASFNASANGQSVNGALDPDGSGFCTNATPPLRIGSDLCSSFCASTHTGIQYVCAPNTSPALKRTVRAKDP